VKLDLGDKTASAAGAHRGVANAGAAERGGFLLGALIDMGGGQTKML
jgi:hypothetical protein